MINTPPISALNLRSGERVRIRSKEEILSTLDGNGRLDEMPFMPEMFEFCGQEFTVSKRAHKTCDPVNGLQSRRLPKSVHLENLRCNGISHGGCQAGCLLFWKEAWLQRLNSDDAAADTPPTLIHITSSCSVSQVDTGTLAVAEQADTGDPTYVCQATQVAAATVPLPWWDVRQYVEDYMSGNATIMQMVSAFSFWVYHSLCGMGLGVGSAMRWAYDCYQTLIGGSPYPWRHGKVPKGMRTPSEKQDIQEGELVTIKRYGEILETLDEEWKNRGLYFDAEMVPYTGTTVKVVKRVQRIIDEKTGKMLTFKTAALILDNVVCQARYAKCRKLCPRAYYLYWRELWVRRASAPSLCTSPDNESVSYKK